METVLSNWKVYPCNLEISNLAELQLFGYSMKKIFMEREHFKCTVLYGSPISTALNCFVQGTATFAKRKLNNNFD